MEPIINKEETRGRPPEGLESKTVDRKVRLEPSMDKALTQTARRLGVTRAAAIREGIILFLRKYGGYY